MSSEKSAGRTLRKATLTRYPGAHWQRLEDKFSIGVPDVCAAHASWPRDIWIELKEIDSLPKRHATPVKHTGNLEHALQQAIWHEDAQRAGRVTCLMIRAPGCWMWFDEIKRFGDLARGVPWHTMQEWAAHITNHCDPTVIDRIVRRNA